MQQLSTFHRLLAIILVLATIVILYTGILRTDNKLNHNVPNNKTRINKSSSLIEALNIRSSANKTILLALTDLGAYDMTINFYETSIKKHGIQNYLFYSTSSRMCDLLNGQDIACILYGEDFETSNTSSLFGSKDFIRKTNLRIYLVLDALKMRFNVLNSDVDVLYNSNPFLDLPCLDGKCDVAIMWDSTNYNSGFLYIRSCDGTIALYNDMKSTAERTSEIDQAGLNQAMERLKSNISVIRLPESKYSCGKYYYQDPPRHYADEHPPNVAIPVVIHNNWIFSMEAKRYRFKENLQWVYDSHGYYSSKSKNYITYENPLAKSFIGDVNNENTYWEAAQKALQNALLVGEILNRTVILPKFFCNSRNCSLLNFIRLRDFDQIFNDRYRENRFLKHPKVPMETVSSQSPMHFISASKVDFTMLSHGISVRVPCDIEKGPTKKEILDWFGGAKEKVLRFSAFYGNFTKLEDLPFGSFPAWKEAFKVAFHRAGYMQE